MTECGIKSYIYRLPYFSIISSIYPVSLNSGSYYLQKNILSQTFRILRKKKHFSLLYSRILLHYTPITTKSTLETKRSFTTKKKTVALTRKSIVRFAYIYTYTFYLGRYREAKRSRSISSSASVCSWSECLRGISAFDLIAVYTLAHAYLSDVTTKATAAAAALEH